MQFERNDSETHPYRVVFEGDETEVIQAVYTEELNRRLTSGDTDGVAVDDYDYRLVDVDDEEETLPITVKDPKELIDRLEQFHQRTSDEVVEIAETSQEPLFRNTDTLLRHELGQRAVEMAMELREMAHEQLQFEELDIDSIDLDSAFSKLLSQEAGSDQDEPGPPQRWG